MPRRKVPVPRALSLNYFRGMVRTCGGFACRRPAKRIPWAEPPESQLYSWTHEHSETQRSDVGATGKV